MRKSWLIIFAVCLAFGSMAFAEPGSGDSKGWLGVTLGESKVVCEKGDTPTNTGVRILTVIADSPADKGGLEDGDVIVKIDDEAVKGSSQVVDLIRAKKPGDTVRVIVLRDGKEKTCDVKLDEKPVLSVDKSPGALIELFGDKCKFLKGFEGFQETKRGYVGMHIQNLTPELREYFGADKETGILISKVEKDGPADRAGLQAGDVIVTVNGKDIKKNLEFQQVIRELKKGDEARLTILRRERKMDIRVVADERSAVKTSILTVPGEGGEVFTVMPELDAEDGSGVDLRDLTEAARHYALQIHDQSDKEKEAIEIFKQRSSSDEEKLTETLEKVKEYLSSEDFQAKLKSINEMKLKQEERVQRLEKRIKELEEKIKEREKNQ